MSDRDAVLKSPKVGEDAFAVEVAAEPVGLLRLRVLSSTSTLSPAEGRERGVLEHS